MNLPVCAVAGLLAGALTSASLLLVGTPGYLAVGILLGITAAVVASRYSRGYEFRAMMVSSMFAAGASEITAWWCHPFLVRGAGRDIDLLWAGFAFVVLWFGFAISGIFGSLWVWEGRRPRPWDNGGRAKPGDHSSGAKNTAQGGSVRNETDP